VGVAFVDGRERLLHEARSTRVIGRCADGDEHEKSVPLRNCAGIGGDEERLGVLCATEK
jgi:hypothetical protein